MSILYLWWHLGTLRAQVRVRRNSPWEVSLAGNTVQVMLWSISSTGGVAAATAAHQRWGLCVFLLMRSPVLSCSWAPQPFDCDINSISWEATVIRPSLLLPPVSTTTPRGRREAGRA